MSKIKPLDAMEASIMEGLEKDEFIRDLDAEKRLKDKMMVDPALKKSHPISLRLPVADLEAIQRKAAKAGIPYQTLIKAMLHQLATGQLKIHLS